MLKMPMEKPNLSPEPMAFFGLGLLGLWLAVGRRKQQAAEV